MLFRPLARLISPWLTVYLLVVSVGLPLQRVYCLCLGEQWLSLTDSPHSCQHEGEPSEQMPREAGGEKTKGCQFMTGDHGCDDAQVIVAQLDADFTHQLEDWSLANTAPGTAPTLPFWRGFAPLVSPQWLTETGPDPPPPPAGRRLLVAYQTFLI